MSIKRFVVTLFIFFIFIFGIFLCTYLNSYYKPSNEAIDIYNEAKKEKDFYYFTGNSDKNIDIVMYPGGKVDYRSYSILAYKLSLKGFNAYVVKMPFNLSILDNTKANILKDIVKDKFILMGHSLGGISVSNYAKKYKDKLMGMVYLAAYPIKDLSNTNIKTLGFTASKDNILNKEAYNKNKKYFPENTIYYNIEGGNHSGFGSYGLQANDYEATITNDEQLDYIVSKIVENYK